MDQIINILKIWNHSNYKYIIMNVSYSLLVIGSIASGTFKLWITELCMVRISNYCHVEVF